MRLLERSDALSVLETAHGSAAAGEGRVVLVTGDAGIGKTALVNSFLDGGIDGRVLRGSADDLATPLPLGALRDVARQGSPVLESAIADGAGRDELYPHLIDELERRPHPVALLIEDAHWADEATIDLLTLVGRRIESMSVLLIITYRDHEVGPGHPLRSMLGHLPVGAVERVPLEPLSTAAIAELMPNADASAVEEMTGGNPFYVTALASSDGDASESIADVVLRRVARLGDDERSLAELVSVAPGGLAVPVLERAAPGWTDAAAGAERAGLLEVVDARLAFRHEIARHAVEGALSDVGRLALHGRLVAAMRETGADPAELVHHAERAGDTAAIAEFAPAAAAAAVAAGSHREAVDHLGRVIRAGHDDVATLAGLHEDYAREAWASNQPALSREGADAARDAYRVAGDPVGAARALRIAARAVWYFGDSDAAIDLIDASIAELDGVADGVEERARSLAYRALVGAIARGPDEIEPFATDALALTNEDTGDETLALVYNNVATARSRNGIDAADLLARAELHADRAGASVEFARVLANKAVEAVNSRNYPAAAALIDEAFAGAEARQVLAFHPLLNVTRARHALELDDWEQAEASARWVVSDEVDAGFADLPARVTLARLAVRRGERTAKAEVDALLADATKTGEFQWIAPAASVVAEHALLHDRPDDAQRALQTAAAAASSGMLPAAAAELAAWAARADLELPIDPSYGPHAKEAAGQWEEAVAEWRALGSNLEAAMTAAWCGGESDMLEALAQFDKAGAVGIASWLRARMRAAGMKRIPKGPSGATRKNPAGLTKRQVDVLLLVADGMTNAEIADELFLSTRTVDHHVSAVLMKLEVASRRDAAQKVSELGLR